MTESFYQLVWYFFIYAFLGWCAEIIFAAWKRKRFLNRGLLNGPVCPIYGFSMLLNLIFLDSLKGNFFFLVVGCAVIATLMEYFTGGLMERILKRKWWDYSTYRYNLGGYVCLPFSFLWGLAAALFIEFIHPLFQIAVGFIPPFMGNIVLIVLAVVFIADFLTIAGVLFESKRLNESIADLMSGMKTISNRLERVIYTYVKKRMTSAHPLLLADSQAYEKPAAKSMVFAEGCCFYKLVWLFFIGAFLGDITETIFCYATSGVLMSRSSVVYGPFSIVWGLGIVVLTMMLYRYKDKNDRYIFLFGTVVGGAYEYLCSVFTELVFGTVFWDYSKIPFNLGGRINLLYCFFWGVAAVIWIKLIYPIISGWIEKIHIKPGKVFSWIIIIFMTVNMLMSGMALVRYSSRNSGAEATDTLSVFLDTHFPDERMEAVYPSAIITN